MNDDVNCGRCQVPMQLIRQFKVRGISTYKLLCNRGHGTVDIQIEKDPRTGKTMVRQVRLTGSPDEFRPNSIKPHERFEIEAISYNPSSAHRRTGNGLAIQSAYKLVQGGSMISGVDPMHPTNLHKRIMGY